MFPSVLPLRAIAFQILFLLVAIAVEASVFHRLLKTDPKQSILYASSINLFCTVLGWIVFFLIFNAEEVSSGSTSQFEIDMMNFIFFDRWSRQTATSLILICFVTFFASFGAKELGLISLQWLLKAGIKQEEKKEEKKEKKKETEEESTEDLTEQKPSLRTPVIRVLRRSSRLGQPQVGEKTPSQLRAVLFANAWSYSAILAILLLRFAVQASYSSIEP